MISFVIGLFVGVPLGVFFAFLFASGKVCDLRGKCPLCEALDQNEKLRRKVDDLQFGLLVSENELFLDFDETGERKIFSCVGQA